MKRIITCIFLFSVCTAIAQVPDTDSMLPKIEAEKNDNLRAKIIWHCLGTSETDPVLDMQIAEKLLVHSKKTNDPIEEVIALACLGYDYRAFGDNEKSWQYSLNAVSVAEQNPSEEAKSGANLALAFNYEDNGDYEQALKLFTSSIDYAIKTKFNDVLCIAYLGLGEFYLNQNKVDSALIYTQRGYERSLQSGYRDYIGPLLQQLGSIQARLGNLPLAMSYFELAIKEGYLMKSPKFISSSYYTMAQYYNDANQKDSAMVYAKKAIAALQSTAFINMGISPAKLLLDIYRNNNVDSAFKYSEIYRIAKDSLFNAKTLQQIQFLAFEEKVRQQQATEEKIKEAEQHKHNIQYALIALGIITIIIFFLLLSRSFITNPKLIEFFGVIALLIVFEFLNLLLHPFLENATNHSPLLMLLALVCISALLVPLHHKAEKWATKMLIEKNKSIRLANAKKTIEQLEKK